MCSTAGPGVVSDPFRASGANPRPLWTLGFGDAMSVLFCTLIMAVSKAKPKGEWWFSNDQWDRDVFSVLHFVLNGLCENGGPNLNTKVLVWISEMYVAIVGLEICWRYMTRSYCVLASTPECIFMMNMLVDEVADVGLILNSFKSFVLKVEARPPSLLGKVAGTKNNKSKLG